MKKLIQLPALALIALAVVACGKSNNNDNAPVGAPAVVPDPGPQYPPHPYPNPDPNPQPNPGSVSSWCYQRGGLYYASQDVCKIRETTHYGLNWYMGTINTGLMVFFGDSVTVNAKGSPSVIVGGQNHGAANSFLAQSQGQLILQGNGFNSFQLRTIQITRCYGPNGFGYSCP